MSSSTSKNSVANVETAEKTMQTTKIVPANSDAVASTTTQVTETAATAPNGAAEVTTVASTTVVQIKAVVFAPTAANGVPKDMASESSELAPAASTIAVQTEILATDGDVTVSGTDSEDAADISFSSDAAGSVTEISIDIESLLISAGLEPRGGFTKPTAIKNTSKPARPTNSSGK